MTGSPLERVKAALQRVEDEAKSKANHVNVLPLLNALQETWAAVEEAERREGALSEALQVIADEPMRLHPIAGYMFDVNVQKVAREALNAGAPEPKP